MYQNSPLAGTFKLFPLLTAGHLGRNAFNLLTIEVVYNIIIFTMFHDDLCFMFLGLS